MKKIKKKDSDKFDELVVSMLLGMGALEDDSQAVPTRYLLATIAGSLWFSVFGDIGGNQSHVQCYTLYARFSDPQLAARELGRREANPFSGKWNFHITGAETPEEAVAEIRREIDKVRVQRLLKPVAKLEPPREHA
jgi:hypothetical protein